MRTASYRDLAPATRLGDHLLAVLGLASALVVALGIVLRAAPFLADGSIPGMTLSGLPQDGLPWWPIAGGLGGSALLFGAIVWLAHRAGRAAIVLALLAVCWLTVVPDPPFSTAPTGMPATR
ncbi:MAG: hypothetical protein R3E68_12770 [Burkholderiaceae bacterium]